MKGHLSSTSNAMVRNIFLVDDDKDDQVIFKDAVQSISPTLICDTAVNGKMALDNLNIRTFLPDIIFLDLHMPVMDGYQFLMHLKKSERLKTIPAGIVSTSSSIADMKAGKTLGGNFFLTKPKDFKTLCRKLQQVIAADFSRSEYLIVI
jgi:CheY-like chemotaxis protein